MPDSPPFSLRTWTPYSLREEEDNPSEPGEWKNGRIGREGREREGSGQNTQVRLFILFSIVVVNID